MAFNMTLLIPVLFSVGYWAIGYLSTVIGQSGEPFDIRKTLRTLAAGIIVGILQGLAGISIAPADITTWTAFIGLVVVVVNKMLNLYSSPAPAAAVPAAAAAARRPVAVAFARAPRSRGAIRRSRRRDRTC